MLCLWILHQFPVSWSRSLPKLHVKWLLGVQQQGRGEQQQPEAMLLAGTCHGLFSRHFCVLVQGLSYHLTSWNHPATSNISLSQVFYDSIRCPHEGRVGTPAGQLTVLGTTLRDSMPPGNQGSPWTKTRIPKLAGPPRQVHGQKWHRARWAELLFSMHSCPRMLEQTFKPPGSAGGATTASSAPCSFIPSRSGCKAAGDIKVKQPHKDLKKSLQQQKPPSPNSCRWQH